VTALQKTRLLQQVYHKFLIWLMTTLRAACRFGLVGDATSVKAFSP
jgi:hypothetical protein